MEGLLRRVEKFIMETEDPDDPEALKAAMDFGLTARREQCAAAISKGIKRHVKGLARYADEPAMLEPLWPSIFEAAGCADKAPGATGGPVDGADQPPSDDKGGSVSMVWPLVEKAVQGGMWDNKIRVSNILRGPDDFKVGMYVVFENVQDPAVRQGFAGVFPHHWPLPQSAGKVAQVTKKNTFNGSFVASFEDGQQDTISMNVPCARKLLTSNLDGV